MGSKVFVIDELGGLQPFQRSRFLDERQLDQYVERYPELLANALSSDENLLRFVLVETQATIRDAESMTERWRADAMFLDQHGILTIVEDKLAKNSEIRRKIVGQMIEYVANLLLTLNADGLEQRLANNHDDVDQVVVELLNLSDATEATKEQEVEDFWDRVTKNLLAGRVRMVFVADQLPHELRQIIEFLNRYMNPMEVLGIAIDCLRPPSTVVGPEVLVTSLVGVVPQKVVKPDRDKSQSISDKEFFDACANLPTGTPVAQAAKELVAQLRSCNELEFQCRRTPKKGTLYCDVVRTRDGMPLLNISIDGDKIGFNLGKVNSLREELVRLSGYDLDLQGKVDQWCALSEENANKFFQWILDAARNPATN